MRYLIDSVYRRNAESRQVYQRLQVKGGKVKQRGSNGKKLRAAAMRVTPTDDRFRVRALDPQEKCGAATSVQELYRVDEDLGNGKAHHLVFFDRHGWYCLHGPHCPAVAQARRFGASERH